MLKKHAHSQTSLDTRFITGVPVIVIIMALVAITASAAIGYYSYKRSIAYAQTHYQQIYLAKARLVASEARHFAQNPHSEITSRITAFYNSLGPRSSDEYLCVVDGNAVLLIHTAHDNTVGNNAGENLILNSNNEKICSLYDLVVAKKDFVGNYVSSAGQKQIAAFAHLKEFNWTIGVHRAKNELQKEVRSSFLPIMKGFIFIILGLLPISFTVLFITFYKASRRRNAIEKHLQEMLHEKEIMLKEIHHRVKNNLQVIVSLINLQGDRGDDEKENTVLKTIEQRINSMKVVHESLYQSDGYTSMSFKDLIETLIHEAVAAWSKKSDSVAIKTEISDLQISLNQAIPCALILNELLMNSLHHAFTDRQEGTVFISAHEGIKPEECIITYRDDGPGFDGASQPEKGMGLIIVDALVKQLKGTLTSDTLQKSLYRITFMIEQQ